MRKVALIIIGIGVSLLSFYIVYNVLNDQKEKESIETYIEETSIVEEINEIQNIVEPVKEEKKAVIDYKAILEIPIINLKEGLVEVTENFKSLNYAVSIDSVSNYPSEYGNFILYAHSGRSNISFFKNLNKVNINDNVYIYYSGYKYTYKIYDKYEIEKTGTMEITIPKNNKIITLLTCVSGTNKQVVLIGNQIKEEMY